MKKFDGVLLVSDFDDTLRTYGTELVPERNLAAIEYFRQNGGIFSVATGRDLRSFKTIMPLMPFPTPVIVGNGVIIYDPAADKLLFESQLADSCAADLEQVLGTFSGTAAEVHCREQVYIVGTNETIELHVGGMQTEAKHCPAHEIPLPWNKICIICDAPLWEENPMSHEIAEYINANFGESYTPAVTCAMIDVAAKNITKESGVTRLAEKHGIDMQNVYAVGDGWNDMDMLRLAKIGFAPEKCAAGVREMGARIVGSCDNGAVADVIEILDGMY